MITLCIIAFLCSILVPVLLEGGVVETIMSAIMGFLVGLFLGCIIAIAVGLFFETKTISSHHCYIYSLGDKSNVEGSFFLGSGSVKEKEYYVFYSKDNIGYKYSKLETSSCRIQETDERPELIRNKSEFVDSNMNLWGIPKSPEAAWILKVPKGTIIRNYKLDLE